MNSTLHTALPSNSESGEETLRLIASLPAPEGLEDRVYANLGAVPEGARVLAWPSGLRSTLRRESDWMRTAAAAAIVFVVVGGGWGVYTRVQQNQPARVIVMPARMPGSGGFSGAGAIRTPQTLQGPVVNQPVGTNPVPGKAAKKPAAAASKPTVQVGASR